MAGNEGYDVSRYESALTVDPVSGAVAGTVTMDRPMPSYAAGVVVGRLRAADLPPVDGVSRRDYFAEELAGEAEPVFQETGAALEFFSNLLGRYPFASYGVHALRQVVGKGTFLRILREWVRRYAYANATTPDFIALVKELAVSPVTSELGPSGPRMSAAEIDALFNAWLYELEVPSARK